MGAAGQGHSRRSWQPCPSIRGRDGGGADEAIQVARQAYAEGDYRWVVEVFNHVLFADETHAEARAVQADAFERLGFGAENGTRRNAFLAGATELRHGPFGTPMTAASPDLMGALSVDQILASIVIRIDGPKARNEHLVISWVVTDETVTYVSELRNGALNYGPAAAAHPDGTTLTLGRRTLIGLVTGTLDLPAALADGTVTLDGNPADLQRLIDLLAPVEPDFAIITS